MLEGSRFGGLGFRATVLGDVRVFLADFVRLRLSEFRFGLFSGRRLR